MTTYKRDADLMIEIRPFVFVNNAFLNVASQPVEITTVDDPRNVELHRIAKLIRDAIEAGEEV